MASAISFKSLTVGQVLTSGQHTLTILDKVKAHTDYPGQAAYIVADVDGVEMRMTMQQLCKRFDFVNDSSATTYESKSTGKRVKILSAEQIDAKVLGIEQRISAALKVLKDLGVSSHLAAVRAEADFVLEEYKREMTAASIKAQEEADAKAAAQAQAAADKAMAAIKALTPEQMNALLAALAK